MACCLGGESSFKRALELRLDFLAGASPAAAAAAAAKSPSALVAACC